MRDSLQDMRKSFKKFNKTNAERCKLLVIILITLCCITTGTYGIITSLISDGMTILLFIVSVIGLWFGVGLLDMLRDMVKFNK
tara:strand:- start:170 stop:418 length:249 start_codon:yes stop_codon:yes gene_type:complete